MALLESFASFMASHPSLNLHSLSLTAFLGLAFAYFVTLKLPKGLPRLLSILPFFPSYLLLPWTISSGSVQGMFCYVFCWTCPSKLLLLCWDASIDCSPWTFSSFFHFLPAMVLPIRVKGETSKLTLKIWADSSNALHFIACICIGHVHPYGYLLPRVVQLYGNMYIMLQVLHWIYATLMYVTFGVELDPAFDSPFFSTSLVDFWGRRWNLLVTNLLRPTVYKPVLHLLSRARYAMNLADQKPGLWDRVVAMWACFLVSGFMHEFIFFYVLKYEPTGTIAAFFVINGIASTLEIALSRVLPKNFKLPTPVAVVCTLTFVCMVSLWFYMPVVSKAGSDLFMEERSG